MAIAKKPNKPHPDFPLYAHRNGQWAKKIKGKTWFFGKWDDPDAALVSYLDERDEILAGRDPRRQRGVATPVSGVTIADVVNLYLEALDARKLRGDVSTRHFSDCFRTGELIVKHFGRRATAESLRAADFAEFRKSFPKTWGPTKIGTEVQRVRGIFRWAAEAEVIPALPNFGPEFKKPAKRISRIAKADRQAEHGRLDFTATELRKLLKASSGWLKACVLLGINAGFGNIDCGRLRADHIDFETGWYDLPRRKSGIPRRFFVWQETRNAIATAMADRPVAKLDEHDALCFLTSHGRPVYWESETDKGTVSRCDNVGDAFRKLVTSCGLQRPGRGFYSLRRTFETVAGNTQDQVAVNFVMGHDDDSMAGVYRQGIDDDRLVAVANYVHDWLFPPPKTGKAAPTE